MKKIKRLLSVCVLICMLITAVAGCGGSTKKDVTESTQSAVSTGEQTAQSDSTKNFKEMKIRVLFSLPKMDKVKEDKLTSIWREKTKISMEIISEPEGVNPEQYIQMLTVANNLPEMIVKHTYVNNTKVLEPLIKGNLLYDFNVADVKKYMPNYTKRVEELGASVEEIFEVNKWTDGKVYKGPFVAEGNMITAFPKLRANETTMKDAGDRPSAVYFRDDILKKIFPNARTEEELRELYVKNGGKLTLEEAFGDIPIKNLDDLYSYLKKVKELNLKVGSKPVIPSQLTSSSDGTSINWSLLTAFGQYWYGAWGTGFKGDQVNFPMANPKWKDYMKFFNTLYNEGLSDPEGWIAKSEQINAKAINGEYAVMNYWLPVNDARGVSKKENRGYGYRQFPLFNIPLDNEYQDISKVPISYTSSGVGVILTKQIKEEDLPQIYNWLDWNCSKEAAELRAWGPPEFYTGEGKDRRFKPEYKDVENMYLTGAEGGKDLFYYGMFPKNIGSSGPSIAFNPEVYMLEGYAGYEELMPQNVYPKTITKDSDIDAAIAQLLKQEYRKNLVYYKQDGWTIADLDNLPAWNTAAKKAFAAETGALIAKAIVAKPANFDKEYETYYNTVFGAEFQKAFEELKAKWKEIYTTKVAPAVAKASK